MPLLPLTIVRVLKLGTAGVTLGRPFTGGTESDLPCPDPKPACCETGPSCGDVDVNCFLVALA